MQVTHAMCTISLPYITEADFWTDNSLDSPFLYSPGDTMTIVSENKLKCGLITLYSRTLSHFPLSLGPEKFLDDADIWLLPCCINAATKCFTDNGFQKGPWSHVVVYFIQLCGFLMCCCLKGQRSQAFSVGFSLAPYMQIFLFLWYYGMLMVKSLNCFQFCVEKCCS